MFSGIVTAIGTIRSIARLEAGLEFTIRAPYRGLRRGESIAVNGACLTVVATGKGSFRVQVVHSSLGRTRFGELERGARVNLERALRAGDRLGGHLVQGHVDGIARVARLAESGTARLMDLEVNEAVVRVSVPLGSIAVDGVSLTVNALPGGDMLQVALIPHTLKHTTLGRLEAGDRVHVEADLLGKYVWTMLQRRGDDVRNH